MPICSWFKCIYFDRVISLYSMSDVRTIYCLTRIRTRWCSYPSAFTIINITYIVNGKTYFFKTCSLRKYLFLYTIKALAITQELLLSAIVHNYFFNRGVSGSADMNPSACEPIFAISYAPFRVSQIQIYYTWQVMI